MDDLRTKEIQQLIEPILAERDAELVELTVCPQTGKVLVRLLVDTVSGITLAQCAKLNERIGEALESANLIEQSFIVEVSSPGLDRPLVAERDFQRAVGEDLRISVRLEGGSVRELKGMLLSVRPDAIVLKTDSGNLNVNMSDVRQAKRVIRL